MSGNSTEAIIKRLYKREHFWQFRRAPTLILLKVSLLGGFTYCYTVTALKRGEIYSYAIIPLSAQKTGQSLFVLICGAFLPKPYKKNQGLPLSSASVLHKRRIFSRSARHLLLLHFLFKCGFLFGFMYRAAGMLRRCIN